MILESDYYNLSLIVIYVTRTAIIPEMTMFDSVKEMERNISWSAKVVRDKSEAGKQYKFSASTLVFEAVIIEKLVAKSR